MDLLLCLLSQSYILPVFPKVKLALDQRLGLCTMHPDRGFDSADWDYRTQATQTDRFKDYLARHFTLFFIYTFGTSDRGLFIELNTYRCLSGTA